MNETDKQRYDALMRLSDGKYDAFLYDCDGTLADSMPGHAQSYVAVAAREVSPSMATSSRNWQAGRWCA
jgi:beta-phosphoglucomutase-like phosphatase (HAD superfamily)